MDENEEISKAIEEITKRIAEIEALMTEQYERLKRAIEGARDAIRMAGRDDRDG